MDWAKAPLVLLKRHKHSRFFILVLKITFSFFTGNHKSSTSWHSEHKHRPHDRLLSTQISDYTLSIKTINIVFSCMYFLSKTLLLKFSYSCFFHFVFYFCFLLQRSVCFPFYDRCFFISSRCSWFKRHIIKPTERCNKKHKQEWRK